MGTFYVFITDGETSRQIGEAPTEKDARQLLETHLDLSGWHIRWVPLYDFAWFAYAATIEGRALGSVRYLKYTEDQED